MEREQTGKEVRGQRGWCGCKGGPYASGAGVGECKCACDWGVDSPSSILAGLSGSGGGSGGRGVAGPGCVPVPVFVRMYTRD